MSNNNDNDDINSKSNDNLRNDHIEDDFDIKNLLKIVIRRKKLAIVAATSIFLLNSINVVYKRLFRPIYEANFNLLIADPLTSGRGGNSSSDNIVQSSFFESLARNNTQNDIPTLIELLKSPAVLGSISEKYEIPVKRLSSNISIGTGGFGNRDKEAKGVLKIKLRISDPKKGKKLIDELGEAYLKVAVDQRQKKLTDGLSFLDEQKSLISEKKKKLSNDLANFQEKNSFINPTFLVKSVANQELELKTKLIGLESLKLRLSDIKDEINDGTITARGFSEVISTGSPAGADASSPGRKGLLISDSDEMLLKQLSELELKLAQARTRFKSDSKTVKSYEKRISEIKPILKTNKLKSVDTALSINDKNITNIKLQLKKIKETIAEQPQIIKEFEIIKDDLINAQANYNAIVNAQETFQLELAQNTLPWTYMQAPRVEPFPVKPAIPRDFITGGLIAIIAGFIAALIRDRLDYVYHNASEVKEILNYPVLGSFPFLDYLGDKQEDKKSLEEQLSIFRENSKNEEIYNYQKFFYQESLRNIYTALRFISTEKDIKSITVTSTIPGEGKSLTSLLLAKTLSELGQRILLIDTDMRKPTIHSKIGINNLKGLSNLLTDRKLKAEDLIVDLKDNKNLKIITAGLKPPDTINLLGSKRMKQISQELNENQNFDLIIYDCPPALALADAELVAECTDGIILVVSLGKVEKNLPKEALLKIKQNKKVQILGMILNGMKPTGKNMDGYGYGYGYGYMDTYIKANSENKQTTSEKIEEDKLDVFRKKLNLLFSKIINWLDK